VVEEPEGFIAHAELRHGHGMTAKGAHGAAPVEQGGKLEAAGSGACA
jgi:hypothetical protein